MLESLKDSTLSFDKATHDTRDNFISVAKSYLKKVNTDNQEQDFKQALDDKYKDIDNRIEKIIERYEEGNKEQLAEIKEHKKITEQRMNKNDDLLKRYNKSLKVMFNGFTGLLFAGIIIALISVVMGPLNQFFGIENLFNTISHVIKTGDSAWRYLAFIGYVIPYIFFVVILLLVLKLKEYLENR